MDIRLAKIILKSRATRIALILTLLFFVAVPSLRLFEAQASQLTPLTDVLADDGMGKPNVTHILSFTSPSSVVSGKTYTVYLQCSSGTPATAFNAVSASSLLVKDGSTTIYSGAGTVGSCTSGNVSTFASLSFIPIMSGVIAAGVNIGDTITISGITATNPNVAATASAPFIVDVQDDNSPADEGFAAIPISSSNQLTMTVVMPSLITLGLDITSVNSTDVIGVNTSSIQPTLTSTCNGIGGESIYVYDSGNPSDATGALGGLWSAGAAHKIASVANTGSGTALTTSIEGYGINGGSGSALLGTFSVQAPYSSATSTVVGGFLKNSTTLFASSPGPVANGTTLLTLSSSILPYTPSGMYADTITFIAVGSF